MKVCPKCNMEKQDFEFAKSRDRKGGLNPYCKICCRKSYLSLKNKPSNETKYKLPNKETFEKDYLSMTNAGLCKLYKCPAIIIGKWIKELGIISKHDRIIKLEKEKIIELYSNDTISAVDIALKFNCAPSKILYWLKKWGVKIRITNKASLSKRWQGYEELYGAYWNTVAKQAKKRNLEFKIKIEFAWELFVKQNRKCALTGLDLIMSQRLGSTCQTASLDRIDSSKGYIENNIHWVHKDINQMKWDLNIDRFKHLCKLVTEYKK